MLFSARGHDGERAVEPLEDQPTGLAYLKRERRVDDVRRGEAVMEPAAFFTEPLGHGVDEGGGVVVERRLDLRHAVRGGGGRVRLERARRLGGHDPELGPGHNGRELDLEPGREPALVRPDPGHGRAGIARDH